ncbi:SRPBCC family protein [Nocardioides terrisoli]|uniref:SRPBCC family protein n=1 Tax=Nocardioides terrisoli TaxID=3388267 RepID=UPI00287BB9EF|nr:SRPBCC domain-containing protein [Nocardioides marmorisolisilvae]
MQLTHDFTVPASIEETWAALNDIEGVAGCFPGATVTSAEGDTFKGSCKVKLGPIALVYNGSGRFIEKDEGDRRMAIEAKGKDKRGNGTAGADVVATMTPSADGTRVTVVTDLKITGKPAQFGRGVMQDVSDKLLGQFVECLARRLESPEPAVDQDSGPASQPTGAAAEDSPASDPDAGPASAPQPEPVRDPARTAPAPQSTDDALDLGATVLPVLARTYWRHALAGVLALLVLRRVVRRKRR